MMATDWDLVIKITVPLTTLVAGKYLDRLERRPKLICYFGHSAAFTIRGDRPATVHTHALVVQNAGRMAATNVRIGHLQLPENYQIYPAVEHSVVRAPSGTAEIVIPKLVPSEQVTIYYLYFPPLLWNQIHSYAKSDEGLAKVLNVIPTPQPSKWLVMTAAILMFVGAVALLYQLVDLLRRLVA